MSSSLILCASAACVRRLNHRPIGDWIAVRNTNFKQMASAPGKLLQHRGGELQIRIAGRHKRHQRFALFAAEVGKQMGN